MGNPIATSSLRGSRREKLGRCRECEPEAERACRAETSAGRGIGRRGELRAAGHGCERRAMQRAASRARRGERATCCLPTPEERSSADPGVGCSTRALVAHAQTPSPALASAPRRLDPASDRVLLESCPARHRPLLAPPARSPHSWYPPPRSESTRTRRVSSRNGYQQYSPGTAPFCSRTATSLNDNCE
jgi:hypothetical protein